MTITLFVFLYNFGFAQGSQLIGYHNTYYDASSSTLSYVSYDSTHFTYRAGNNKSTSAQDFKNNIIQYDTAYRDFFFYITYKNAITYNNNNDVILSEYLEKNSQTGGGYVATDRSLFEYDANYNLTSAIYLHYDVQNTIWDTVGITQYTYNTNGDITTLLKWTYNSTGQMTPLRKTTYTYNNQYKVIKEVVEYNYALSQQALDTMGKVEYHYDANNNLDTFWGYSFVSAGVYNKNNRFIYNYNGKNQVTYESSEAYLGNNTWEYQWRSATAYDAQDRRISKFTENYDIPTQSFVPAGLDSFIYKTSAPQQTTIRQDYDNIAQKLMNFKRIQYSYNSFGQMTRASTLSWDVMSNTWAPNGGDDSTEYYYADPANVNNIDKNNLSCSLYPNPAASFITVSSAILNESNYSIYIYGLSGRLMGKVQGSGTINKTIPVAHLSTGQYILKLQTDQGSITKQFTVLK